MTTRVLEVRRVQEAAEFMSMAHCVAGHKDSSAVFPSAAARAQGVAHGLKMAAMAGAIPLETDSHGGSAGPTAEPHHLRTSCLP